MSTQSSIIATRITDRLTATATAATFFGKKPAEVGKFLASKAGAAAIKAITDLIEEEVSDHDSVKFLAQLQEYCRLLPKTRRDEAIKEFERCGDVEVLIRLGSDPEPSVTIRRMSIDLPQGYGQPEPQPEPGEAAPAVIEERTEKAKDQPRDRINRSVVICIPTNRDFNPKVNLCINAQLRAADREFGHENVRYIQKTETVIDQARNHLAMDFLSTGFEWSFWMDNDMIAPMGNPAWFRKIAESNGTSCQYRQECIAQTAIIQLTNGPHKIASAVYASRNSGRKHVNQLGMHPKDKGESEFCNSLRRGPRTEFKPCDWTGFGCVAIHRDVFTSIQRHCPELAPKKDGQPWNFFTGDLTCSEDVAFFKRARKAGHQPMLDCSVFALHIGNAAFLP